MPVPLLPRSLSATATTSPKFGCRDLNLFLQPLALSASQNLGPLPSKGEYGTASHYYDLNSNRPGGGCQPGFLDPTAYLNVLSTTMNSTPIQSPNGTERERRMLAVLGYSPTEGEAEALITVEAEVFSGHDDDDGSMLAPDIKLRVVLGRTALKTTVHQHAIRMQEDGKGRLVRVFQLRITAQVPPYSEVRFPEQVCVPMTLQAMMTHTDVVESITFGSFTYWESRATQLIMETSVSPDMTLLQPKRDRTDDELRDYSRPSPSPPQSSLGSSKKSHLTQAMRSSPGVSLMRTSAVPHDALKSGSTSHPATLEWSVTPHTPHPNAMENDWSALERDQGRRLVRFHRSQKGVKLLVSCEVIAQELYDEDDIVISCILRRDKNTFWFTSVDVIYLLERLVGSPFSVEEKNRIRRNLEGFKPSTVSKHKSGYEGFFQQIMDFPPPKPRNIEKDVKVFPWNVLSSALDKIISKYSVFGNMEQLSDASPASSPGYGDSLPLSSVQHGLPNDYPSIPPVYDSQYPRDYRDDPPPLHQLDDPALNIADELIQRQQLQLTMPGHSEADIWHRRPSLAPSITTEEYSPNGTTYNPAGDHIPSGISLPYTSAFIHNPSNITLGELSVGSGTRSGHPLQNNESFAHLAPLSNSPRYNPAQLVATPLARSRRPSNGSIDLGYPEILPGPANYRVVDPLHVDYSSLAPGGPSDVLYTHDDIIDSR